jgi:hypothetical protein
MNRVKTQVVDALVVSQIYTNGKVNKTKSVPIGKGIREYKKI